MDDLLAVLQSAPQNLRELSMVNEIEENTYYKDVKWTGEQYEFNTPNLETVEVVLYDSTMRILNRIKIVAPSPYWVKIDASVVVEGDESSGEEDDASAVEEDVGSILEEDEL